MVITIAVWIAVTVRAFENRPSAVLHRTSEKIKPGMKLEEVDSLLGHVGRKIEQSELPRTVDPDEAVDSPSQSKPVVSGEGFFKWETDDGAYVIVSLKEGVVHERFFYAPSS